MVHLTDKCFSQNMAKLSGIWPNEFKSPERLKRYYNACCNVPDEGFNEIVNTIIDNFRTAPLPKDFADATTVWHKNFVNENGYMFGHEKYQDHGSVIECEWCMDSGMLYCSDSSNPETQFFMLCDCPIGNKKQDELIPHWSKQISAAFTRLPFRLKEWIPTESVTTMGLFDMWRSKVNQGRSYWAEARKKPKPVFRQLWSNEEHEMFLMKKKKKMLEDLHAKMESQRGMM